MPAAEALWDLQAKSSPRCLSIYPVVTSNTTTTTTSNNTNSGSSNPFDTAPPPPSPPRQGVVAVVFGTDHGSFHYRTYASMTHGRSSTGVEGVMSSSTSSKGGSSLGGGGGPASQQLVQYPLGRKIKGSASPGPSSLSLLPRHYLPMDLGSLPGPVVQCLILPSRQQQTFLLLVDDNGGGASNRDMISSTTSTTGSTSGSTSGSSSITYATFLVVSSITTPGFQVLALQQPPPRMTCATVVSGNYIVYGVGRTLHTLSPEFWNGKNYNNTNNNNTSSSSNNNNKLSNTILNFSHTILPAPGVRNGVDALLVTAHNKVAVTAIGNSFYALAVGSDEVTYSGNSTIPNNHSQLILKLISFQQSSQVHPAIVLDVQDPSFTDLSSSSSSNITNNSNTNWSSLFLASGRECAVVDLQYADPDHQSQPFVSTTTATTSLLHCSLPRNGIVQVPAPILSAACIERSWIALLQSDGLIQMRSLSCLAVPLRTVEVGQRPNDFFVVLPLLGMLKASQKKQQQQIPLSSQLSILVTAAYSGECRVIPVGADTVQDMADRLMRHTIDALGPTGFPRQELAEAIGSSFAATAYSSSSTNATTATTESSTHAKILLQQYLQAVLGLTDFESGATLVWPIEVRSVEEEEHHHHYYYHHPHHGTFATEQDLAGRGSTIISSSSSSLQSPAALLTGTAILCLVCSNLRPPDANLARRAAKAACDKMGVVLLSNSTNSRNPVSKWTVMVCEQIADQLLRDAASNFTLTPRAPPISNHSATTTTDLVEAAIGLLRACGRHERAIDVTYERLHQRDDTNSSNNYRHSPHWSQIKYESYTATHLSELWGSRHDEGCQLVLQSTATHRLLERNPRLGLSVFTALHPQNEAQWRALPAHDDPLAHPERVRDVLKLLKSIQPVIPYDQDRSMTCDDQESVDGGIVSLSLESGRALAVSYLRSAVGISTGRPINEDVCDKLANIDFQEHVSNIHDELAFMLLEGVISERTGDDMNSVDSELGMIFRSMLKEFLKWPRASFRPEQFMESLPPSFLQEKALVLGRLNRHEDALRILYRDLQSLDLALEYCDDRYAQQKLQQERKRSNQQNSNNSLFPEVDIHMKEEDNAYLPLVRVALESPEDDTDRGTATAIQVLALRRSAIDRAAALRLLPSEVPVSAVARPFLIPALVESESQVRRMTVVSALLRSRFLRLKDQLTSAQLKAQANIYVVPALKSLNLGDPLHSTKSFKARTVNPAPGSTMPFVEIVKHFFPRHLVIQAKVTNVPYTTSNLTSATALTFPDKLSLYQSNVLSDIAFVVAESSEEEAIQPLLHTPIQVLPPKMTGSAWCVLQTAPQQMDSPTAQLTCELRYAVQTEDGTQTRTYVEELQDLEVQAAYFS